MSERKVLNKYYPPDFDPSKLTKIKRQKDKQDNVRMMLPMSVRCDTCGNFLYIGTKFNMRKETCNDEEYLGIKIYRFYFKCTRCYAEVTMKTDPKNHDYVCEHGASRNYEPWRDIQHAENVLRAKRQLEDDDAMKNLENRTYDSKREMDILDALEEVKQMNKRLAKVNHEQLLLKTLSKYDRDEDVMEKQAKDNWGKEKEKLKYKRINEDEPYEDADNFDSHIGFHNISNPYDLLDQLENGFSLGSDSDSSDEDDDDPDTSQQNKSSVSFGTKSDDQKRLELKRKQPETASEDKFESLLMFKKPADVKSKTLPFLMKKKKVEEPVAVKASIDLLGKLCQYDSD